MESSVIKFTPELIAEYRAAALRGQEERVKQLAPLRERAWVTARRAAEILRDQFHVTRVVVFGSLVRPDCFTAWSDIDIAAWGIAPEDTLRAIAAVSDVDETIMVNLVDVNTCRSSILVMIAQDGIEIY
jgi:predicted nucleotidyltransferase